MGIKKTTSMPATKQMLAHAANNIPVVESYSYTKRVVYKTKIYMRAKVENEILKVAIYKPEHLLLKAKEPCYELYIDRKKQCFKTWDNIMNKWLDSKLDNLLSNSFFSHYSIYISSITEPEIHISLKEKKIISSYLNVSQKTVLNDILYYQNNIRHYQLLERHRKITDPWDAAMKNIKPLPKKFNNWVQKNGTDDHFIFYKSSRSKKRTGYCSRCKKEVPITNPKHNTYTVCPHCKGKVQFKAAGKGAVRNQYWVYYLQPYKDSFVIRLFDVHVIYKKNEFRTPIVNVNETHRIIHEDGIYVCYYYGLFKNRFMRWQEIYRKSSIQIKAHYYYSTFSYATSGKTYTKNLKKMCAEFLGRTGLYEMLQFNPFLDPEYYLLVQNDMPVLEKLAKSGLTQLAMDILKGKAYKELEITLSDHKKLAKSLDIDNARMKRLREMNGGLFALKWLQYEKGLDTIFQNDVIRFFESENILPKDIQLLRKHMKDTAIATYLKKQKSLTNKSVKELIQTYADYYNMSLRHKRNMNLELFYKPKDLQKAHDELVELSQDKNIALRAGEIIQKYPHVDEICEKIKQKYEFQSQKDGYAIILPSRVEDIIVEGRTLRHCVDSSDFYFDRINRRESYICFLRKINALDTPYYTLEIEPNGTIRQKRTTGDKQEKDFDQAKEFLKHWQKEIQKNITQEDRDLAEISALLRVENFKELRKNNSKIWRGALQGQLLADVLEADLMEVVTCA